MLVADLKDLLRTLPLHEQTNHDLMEFQNGDSMLLKLYLLAEPEKPTQDEREVTDREVVCVSNHEGLEALCIILADAV